MAEEIAGTDAEAGVDEAVADAPAAEPEPAEPAAPAEDESA